MKSIQDSRRNESFCELWTNAQFSSSGLRRDGLKIKEIQSDECFVNYKFILLEQYLAKTNSCGGTQSKDNTPSGPMTKEWYRSYSPLQSSLTQTTK